MSRSLLTSPPVPKGNGGTNGMTMGARDTGPWADRHRRKLFYAFTAILVVAVALLGAFAYLSSKSQGVGACNPCGGPPFGLGGTVVSSSMTGTTVSSAWANLSVTSSSPQITIGSLAFSLQNATGATVRMAQSQCAPFWTGSTSCSSNSLTVTAIQGGTVLLTYNLATSSWGAPGGGSTGTLVTAGMALSLELTMTGTDVAPTALSGQGYSLVATGHGSFSGSDNVAIP